MNWVDNQFRLELPFDWNTEVSVMLTTDIEMLGRFQGASLAGLILGNVTRRNGALVGVVVFLPWASVRAIVVPAHRAEPPASAPAAE